MKDEEKDKLSFSLSFIVRLWVERPSMPEEPQKLRGQIIHVPSGERRYLQHLDEISGFIFPYLQDLGIVEKARAVRRKRWWRFRRD